uniref:high-affinity nitrate transporter 3.2-like n=1 Tax=Erigeron canadensis TaxID=72917 RepID=UPI001CB97665|nr:high-affinity nitrate transporter 3.2-like [Erigeron canadensis]
MEVHPTILLLLVSCFVTASYAHNVHLSSLNQSLIVTTSPKTNQVLKAGEDNITITWTYNTNLTASMPDTNYTTVEAKLCYAPVSQTGHDDRKTDDNLDIDKTCPFDITDGPYKRSNNSFTWSIPKDIPKATYFVRVYAVKANKHEIAYGQSTDTLKTTNLFQIDGVISNQKVSASSSVAWNYFVYCYALMLLMMLLV